MKVECVVTVEGAGWGLLTIPKVAATSMRTALVEAYGHELMRGEQVHRHPALRWGRERVEWWATFVRHPLDRLVSCWADRIRGPRPSKPMLELGYRRRMGFGEFVERVAEVGPGKDPHTATQWDHIRTAGLPTFVGRYEQLEGDWNWLRMLTAWRLGPLPHMQASKREPWPRYYEDEGVRALACELYEDDFRQLGYRP